MKNLGEFGIVILLMLAIAIPCVTVWAINYDLSDADYARDFWTIVGHDEDELVSNSMKIYYVYDAMYNPYNVT